MKLSEDIQHLWMQFMDAYAANTAGRHFSAAELQVICARLSEMGGHAAQLESLIPPPPEPPETDDEKVISFQNYKNKHTHQGRG